MIFREERSEAVAQQLAAVWERNYLANKRWVVMAEDIDVLEKRTKEGKPKAGLVVGAGPSLKKNLKDIDPSLYRIICCEKISSKLVDMGIIPEFVVALNAEPTDVRKWLEAVSRPGVTLIVPCGVDPEAIKGWKGHIQWVNAITPTGLHERVAHETHGALQPMAIGSNAGTFGYVVAAEGFRLDPVAYIGLDFSFLTREEVTKRFIVGYYDNLKVDQARLKELGIEPPVTKEGPLYSKEYNVLEMGDINGETRWLDLGWFDMAQAFQERVRRMQDWYDTRTVNCTEGGINASKYVDVMTLAEFNKLLREGYYEVSDNRVGDVRN